MDSQQQHIPVYSVEFFPPKTPQGMEKLLNTHEQLAALQPAFFSVTFGAGGTTRDRTLDTVLSLQQAGSTVAPHISCIASSKTEIQTLLDHYRDNGIKHLVALRGDMPSGAYAKGDFAYASELVSFIRETYTDHFFIEVAAYPEFHPQAANAEADMQYFIDKVRRGADSAITQYFYNADAYFQFIERCEQAQLNIPIVPGIMPITNYLRLARFSDACGAEIPRWLRKQLEYYQDDTESLYRLGLDVVGDLCQRLLDAGVPGLHFYCMNQAEPTTTLWRQLGLVAKG